MRTVHKSKPNRHTDKIKFTKTANNTKSVNNGHTSNTGAMRGGFRF